MHTNHEGGITVSRLLILAVMLLGGMQALKFVSPWVSSLRLQSAMQEVIDQAPVLTEPEMIQAVMAQARALNLPLAPQDIRVIRDRSGSLRLYAEYDVTVTFPFGSAYTLSFRPEAFHQSPAGARGFVAR